VCRVRQAEAHSQHELEGGSTRPPPSCKNGSDSSRASALWRKLKSTGCASNARSSRTRSSAWPRAAKGSHNDTMHSELARNTQVRKWRHYDNGGMAVRVFAAGVCCWHPGYGSATVCGVLEQHAGYGSAATLEHPGFGSATVGGTLATAHWSTLATAAPPRAARWSSRGRRAGAACWLQQCRH
jgi:hypothetical protein